MKKHVTAISLILTVMASGTALAVGPGKTLEFTGSPMGTVEVGEAAAEIRPGRQRIARP